MNAALVGLGAIGTVIAADLAMNDFPLYVVCKHQETLDMIENRGVKVTGVSGEYIVKENITPVLAIEDLPENLDLVFIVTKLTDIQDAYDRIKGKLSKKHTLVTMTNGMYEEKLAEQMDGKRLLGCVVSFGASRNGPAEAVKTSMGEMVIGRKEGPMQNLDKRLVELLSKTVPTSYSEDIINEKFTKLLINISVASFGVISGMTLGKMLERKYTRIAFLTVLTEGVEVGDAKGVELQRLNNLNLRSLALTRKELHRFTLRYLYKQLIIKIIGRKYKNLRSSSLQSIESGRRTEIDYLNGYLVEQGEKFNIPTPLNRYVLDEVHKFEAGEKKPSLKELENLEKKTREIWEME
jgi:2-dehydropantoate 2-reductase